jgi:hypothetical protein
MKQKKNNHPKDLGKNLKLRRILGITSLIIILVNLYLRFSGKYGDLVFWIVLIIVAIIAWPVMNWLKK